MKKLVPHACIALAFAFAASAPAFSEEAQGDWGGVIAGTIRVTAHITKAPDGSYHADLGSPDQTKELMVADKVTASATNLSISIERLKGKFEGEWDEKQQAWVGTWSQGKSTPLVLKRVDAKGMARLVFKRPQEEAIAKSAAPYSAQEVSFANVKADVKLTGVWSVPPGAGPFPAVVLVAGSGQHTRDEVAFGHKVFMVLADHLNRQGIAVLRYDKRGVGASTGNYKLASTYDFAADAEAAVAYLRTRPEVDARRLGVVGHSEGGMIAPLVAAHDPGLAFIVMLAGPGVRGDKLLTEQTALISRADGRSESDIAKSSSINTEVFAALTAPGTVDDTTALAKTAFDRAVAGKDIDPADAKTQLERLNTPWFRAMLAFDPAPTLRLVKQPVLVMNGARDLQVPAAMNMNAIRAALPPNKATEFIEMPALNHLFQTATTGAPSEYAGIEETFAPVALNKISDWILRLPPAS
ncbi:MAG: alpha/beta hydrolase [Massilia sp.]